MTKSVLLSFLRNCSANDNRWEHCQRLRDYGHLQVLANRASRPCQRPFLRTRLSKSASRPCRRPFFRTRLSKSASRPCRRPFFRMRSAKCASRPCWRREERLQQNAQMAHFCIRSREGKTQRSHRAMSGGDCRNRAGRTFATERTSGTFVHSFSGCGTIRGRRGGRKGVGNEKP